MDNSLVLQNFARFTEIIANVRLAADPIDVTRNTFAEIHGWFVAGRPGERGVASEMTHFPGAKFTVDLGRGVDLQNIGKLFGDFVNRYTASAADVDG